MQHDYLTQIAGIVGLLALWSILASFEQELMTQNFEQLIAVSYGIFGGNMQSFSFSNHQSWSSRPPCLMSLMEWQTACHVPPPENDDFSNISHSTMLFLSISILSILIWFESIWFESMKKLVILVAFKSNLFQWFDLIATHFENDCLPVRPPGNFGIFQRFLCGPP